MPKTGGKTKKNAIEIVLLETLIGKSICTTLARSDLYPAKRRMTVRAIRVVVSGIVERGRKTPNNGYNSLMINPTNIKKAMLKLTEKSIVDVKSLSSNLKSFRMAKPGINIR